MFPKKPAWCAISDVNMLDSIVAQSGIAIVIVLKNGRITGSLQLEVTGRTAEVHRVGFNLVVLTLVTG